MIDQSCTASATKADQLPILLLLIRPIKAWLSKLTLFSLSSLPSWYEVSLWFMLSLAIWLYSELFYSYPMLSCWFNFLDMKAVKELYERRQEEKICGQDIFYILSLYLDSTTIQWGRKLFLNTNEMIESPSQGIKMSSAFLGIYVQIWCSRR